MLIERLNKILTILRSAKLLTVTLPEKLELPLGDNKAAVIQMLESIANLERINKNTDVLRNLMGIYKLTAKKIEYSEATVIVTHQEVVGTNNDSVTIQKGTGTLPFGQWKKMSEDSQKNPVLDKNHVIILEQNDNRLVGKTKNKVYTQDLTGLFAAIAEDVKSVRIVDLTQKTIFTGFAQTQIAQLEDPEFERNFAILIGVLNGFIEKPAANVTVEDLQALRSKFILMKTQLFSKGFKPAAYVETYNSYVKSATSLNEQDAALAIQEPTIAMLQEKMDKVEGRERSASMSTQSRKNSNSNTEKTPEKKGWFSSLRISSSGKTEEKKKKEKARPKTQREENKEENEPDIQELNTTYQPLPQELRESIITPTTATISTPMPVKKEETQPASPVIPTKSNQANSVLAATSVKPANLVISGKQITLVNSSNKQSPAEQEKPTTSANLTQSQQYGRVPFKAGKALPEFQGLDPKEVEQQLKATTTSSQSSASNYGPVPLNSRLPEQSGSTHTTILPALGGPNSALTSPNTASNPSTLRISSRKQPHMEQIPRDLLASTKMQEPPKQTDVQNDDIPSVFNNSNN